jgi:DNA invertase Pin-like site-specific DNA recombinase
MSKRAAIYFRQYSGPDGTDQELLDNLCQAVEDRGDLLVATYTDDGRIIGRGKYTGWRRLLADLDGIEQIVLADTGDLPGKSVNDLLAVLATLTAHDVSIVVPREGIDTSNGPAALLALVAAFRRAKLSAAIRAGQGKARQQGRHVGRPPIPENVRRRIVADLVRGAGIRPTARKFAVAPGSVVNIRQAMSQVGAEAA